MRAVRLGNVDMTESQLDAGHKGARQPEGCAASGWRLRISSADSSRNATCPLCAQKVRPRPEIIGGRSVWVIKEHPRRSLPDRQ